MPEDRPAVRLVANGACSGNPGPGGWACILTLDAHRKEPSGGETQTTQPHGTQRSARRLTRPARSTVVSDSRSVIGAFEKGGLGNSQRRTWKNVKNPDLWQALLLTAWPHTLTFEWVQGHAGHPENERADQLRRTSP
ncbi:RNase H family protein [Deinococcus hopiensis]|uniref:Ribonuclease HI n=1 Tax=Deinococcus hopiensis KR-140 TaxID=695939 RepID=A0A1W1VWI4_9DEIO|nr:RNase H family protein [Deinococcus hopiensis]SMB97613.1 ribonuclease HI [Deinococcus hopiensis KR-140]